MVSNGRLEHVSRAALAVAVAIAAASCGGGDDAPPDPAADASTGRAADVRDASTDASRGSSGGPGLSCTSRADVEVEPDDTPAQATPMTELSFCGVLSSGSDVDYATFTTPPGKKLGSFQAVVNGKVDFELEVGGKTYGPGDPAALVPGTFVVKAFTRAGAAASYQFRIRYDPS